MSNWESKVIAVIIMIGLIAVGVAYCQMNTDAGISGNISVLLLSSILMFTGSIALLISGFILLIAAFNHDVTTGLLFLFLPFYWLYFAIALYDGNHKGWILTGCLGGSLIVAIGVSIFYTVYLNELLSL
jgi:hypothetical protein